jgi:hypothetical protein
MVFYNQKCKIFLKNLLLDIILFERLFGSKKNKIDESKKQQHEGKK